MEHRLELLEELLGDGADIAISHFSGDTHATSYFACAEGACARRLLHANGREESWRCPVSTAARDLLQLLQENHDVTVEQICDHVPRKARRGFPLAIVWPQSCELEQLDLRATGPLPEDMDEKAAKRERLRRVRVANRQAALYRQVRASIACDTAKRQEVGACDQSA